MIFVNSMSDLFHKGVPRAFVDAVFETMESANWHVFQVLTKRSSRLRTYVNARYAGREAPAHIWLGVSIEDGTKLSRVRHLEDTAARVRFLSLEPLIGPIDQLELSGIHWAIVGGESGPGARPMNPDWVRHIRNRCVAGGVPFFLQAMGWAYAEGRRSFAGRSGMESVAGAAEC